MLRYDSYRIGFISTHINPDGDSIGSAFAMYHYLKNLGKDCRIINHSEVPLVYSFLNEKVAYRIIHIAEGLD